MISVSKLKANAVKPGYQMLGKSDTLVEINVFASQSDFSRIWTNAFCCHSKHFWCFINSILNNVLDTEEQAHSDLGSPGYYTSYSNMYI